MISELTPTQERELTEWKEAWFRKGSSTEPANRPVVERAISSMYKEIGNDAPSFVWCASPLSASLIIEAWDLGRGNEVSDESKRPSLETLVKSFGGKGLRPSSFWGSMDSYWVAFYTFCRHIGVKYEEKFSRILDLWADTCEAGWWYPYEGVCFVCDRPELIKWDTTDPPVLHSGVGPAVRFRDGWSVYSWHGTVVPGEWIENPDAVDPSLALTYENMEQRRCLAEIITWEKVLSQLDLKTIDKDEDPHIGELVEVDLPGSPGERFVRVLCATGRNFAISVSREFDTALEALAQVRRITPEQLRNYRSIT